MIPPAGGFADKADAAGWLRNNSTLTTHECQEGVEAIMAVSMPHAPYSARQVRTQTSLLTVLNNKIDAIKWLRSVTGFALKESKETVEAIMAMASGASWAPATPAGGPAVYPVPSGGFKSRIHAIKWVKDISGLPLPECVKGVEAIMDVQPAQPPDGVSVLTESVMTLRREYAKAALASLISSGYGDEGDVAVAKRAWQLADAMSLTEAVVNTDLT